MEPVFYSKQQHDIVIGQTQTCPLPQQTGECDYNRNTEAWD